MVNWLWLWRRGTWRHIEEIYKKKTIFFKENKPFFFVIKKTNLEAAKKKNLKAQGEEGPKA